MDLNQAKSESAENIAEIGTRSKVDDGCVDSHKAEILKFESRVGIPCIRMDEPVVHATNEHEMSPSNIGEKEMSPSNIGKKEMSTSNIGERVDIKPRPSDSDLKKIIAYSKTLRPNMSNEEIREGLVKFQLKNYLSPSQKAAPIKKKKMTVNLFDNAQNFFCKKSVKGKNATPKRR
ncbi:hypothetical protein Tco_0092287 [Tanacetum coccineum]